MPSPFRPGDRVRIIHPNHEYTGCRGTIAEAEDGVTALGHYVAIDGENGLTRPFLATELEPLRAMRAGGRARVTRTPNRDAGQGRRDA